MIIITILYQNGVNRKTKMDTVSILGIFNFSDETTNSIRSKLTSEGQTVKGSDFIIFG